ncbi:MAG: divergent polysaccharide deacetylase family protein [Alphaproteobacteria bacterium]|nr:divergent polysaccharide deacetylase family protein [Alphaproteobacteria bacterium]
MKKTPPARPRTPGVFGVHPVLAAAAAIALVLFGALLGAWFDRDRTLSPPLMATQMPTAQTATAPPPRPSVQPPAYLSIPVDDYAQPDMVGLKPAPARELARPAAVPAMPSRVAAPEPDLPPTAYMVASTADRALPAIAIVIDDLGLDRVRSQRMLDMPGPLTMAFLTYAANLPHWSEQARAAGHEVLAHIPMEPLDPRENPGPGALTMAMTAEQIDLALGEMLAPWRGYVGVNNHMGSRMTADRWRMDLVMKQLRARGLIWLDSRTAPDTAAMAAAETADVPRVARDFFLDNIATVDAIAEQLADVEEHARKTGAAVAIGHPYDATLVALETWITTLPGKGLALVPISELARRRGQSIGASAGAATIERDR